MKWDRIEVFFLLFAFLVFAFFVCYPVPAQEYTVTETQLLNLEKILQSYKDSRQAALSQVSDLKESLAKEREMTMTLQGSLTKYEIQVDELAREKTRLFQENSKLKLDKKNLVLTIVILATCLVLVLASMVVYVIIKINVI